MKSLWMSFALAAITLTLFGLTVTPAPTQPYGVYPYRGPDGQPSVGMGAYVWPSAPWYLGRYNYPSYFNTPYTNRAFVPYTYDPGYNPFGPPPYFPAPKYDNQLTTPQYNLGPAFQMYGTTPSSTAGPYLRYYGTTVGPSSSSSVYNARSGTYFGPAYSYP